MKGGKYNFLWLPTALFGYRFVTFLLDCTFGKMILLCLKSSIPPQFCKLNSRLESSSKKALYSWLVNLPHTDKEVYKAFYGKIFCAAQTVCTRPLLGGGGGGERPGDEVTFAYAQ